MPTELVAAVYMNHGRWVARCPRPHCRNAEMFGRCQDDSIGGLRGDHFHCRERYGGCGLKCPAQWPANVQDVEALLLARPVPATRNWSPGEDLVDLLGENIAHGVVPNEPLAVTSERILPRQIGLPDKP